MKKRWKIISGKCCLVKGGSNPFQQQPFNEVIATRIMEHLNVPHVPYDLVWSDGDPYSVCEDFVSPDTELVSAWRIIQTKKKSNNDSLYQHFIQCCTALGIYDVAHTLDQMLVVDYIIGNEDRHLNNFGFLRNPETLEWLGMAPIFDSGSSLGYDKIAAKIHAEQGTICKPFKKYHNEQIKLVSSVDWIDFDALANIGQVIREILADTQATAFVGADRCEAIVASVDERIKILRKLAETCSSNIHVDSVLDDVEGNRAEDYSSK